jgi:peptide deformylase
MNINYISPVMILPVVAFGHPVLKKVAEPIPPDYPGFHEFLTNMWDTMYQSDGVGLAAPQVNRSIRVIVIDTAPFAKNYPEAENFKKAFINAQIYKEEGEEYAFNEGCLSFPGLHEDIIRKPIIHIRYLDENFVEHDERYDGVRARVIQHEYDHIEGIVFVDRLPSLKRILLKRRLSDISKGNVEVAYKMTFPQMKKGRR